MYKCKQPLSDNRNDPPFSRNITPWIVNVFSWKLLWVVGRYSGVTCIAAVTAVMTVAVVVGDEIVAATKIFKNY